MASKLSKAIQSLNSTRDIENLKDRVGLKLSNRIKKVIALSEQADKDNKKDLDFLIEMYTCSQKLMNEKYDFATLYHLDTMIEHWILELKDN